MTGMLRLVLFVGLVGVLFTSVAVGTVAGQSAPDCSTVSYDGMGTDTNPFEINNVNQLQCVGSQDLDASYEVVSDIDATATASWNGGDGFDPIETFTGTFEGADREIIDLTVNRPAESNVGMFGVLGSSATVKNVSLSGVDVTGSGDVGGLVGANTDNAAVTGTSVVGDVEGGSDVGVVVGQNMATVSGSSADGSVDGSADAGGLVGDNDDGGTVTDSHASVRVDGFDDTGGLVGDNGGGGTIEDSFATGKVDGNDEIGGLVGINDGTVRRSNASGNVDATTEVGGLVGDNDGGSVTRSHATGDVTADDSRVGGLVGNNRGAVTRSFARGATDGFFDVGGLIGNNGDQVTRSYSTGGVNGDGDAGGLVGDNDGGSVVRSYAVGSVNGGGDVGGLVGDSVGTVTDSYWDVSATGQTESGGGTGLMTTKMLGEAAPRNMDGLDFTGTWETVTNPDDYPRLAWQTEEDDSKPANFEVTIDSTNSPVTEGETLTVDVSIENTGEEPDTHQVSLSVGGTERDSTSVTVLGGGTMTETFEWATRDGDAGDYTATVESEDDSNTAAVTVKEPDIDLISVDGPSTVLPDGEFEFTVEMIDSSVGEVAVDSDDFDVELSVIDDAGDSIGAQTDTSVEFIDIDEEDSTYTLNVNVTGGSEGDMGTITAATGERIDNPDVDDQISSTFSLADVSESPVEGVSDELWTVVTQDDGEDGLSLADLGNAIQEYQDNPSDADVGSVSITLSDLGSLIQHYRTEVA